MKNALDIVIEPVHLPETKEGPEEGFDLLVFHPDGSVSIQTNRSIYFYATVYYYAARELSRLLNGEPHELEYGSPDRRITSTECQYDLCIDGKLLRRAIRADQVTCFWPGIVPFFVQLKKFSIPSIDS